MTRLERLKSTPIIGDAFSDQDRFNLANTIIYDEAADFADRIEALREVDRTTGLPSTDIDEDPQASLDLYVAMQLPLLPVD